MAPSELCPACKAFDWRQVGSAITGEQEWICNQCGGDPNGREADPEVVETARRARALRGALGNLREGRAAYLHHFMVELRQLDAEAWNAEVLELGQQLRARRPVA